MNLFFSACCISNSFFSLDLTDFRCSGVKT